MILLLLLSLLLLMPLSFFSTHPGRDATCTQVYPECSRASDITHAMHSVDQVLQVLRHEASHLRLRRGLVSVFRGLKEGQGRNLQRPKSAESDLVEAKNSVSRKPNAFG